MSKHPEWATKFKRKGTELRLLNGRYYLYEVTSKWNPQKKRSQKITGKLLGKITEEDGFIESEKYALRKKQADINTVSVREFGVNALINTILIDYISLIKKHFPEYYREILVLAYCKLAYKSPLKKVAFHYYHSYFSEQFPDLKLTGKHLSYLLKEIGSDRNPITDFFKEFGIANDSILFDGTDLLSNSKKMDMTKFSKTKTGTFDSIINLMFIFSAKQHIPLYYRVLPGNIKDIKAFKLCLTESHIEDALIIVDKGFYSKSNINELKREDLTFIVPLKRNNQLIDYQIIQEGDKQNFEGYFQFEKRLIWYYVIENDEENVFIYLDEELKNQEVKDYIKRIDKLPEEYDIDTFYNRQYRFGTIGLMSNLDKSPEEIFVYYKSRAQIEIMIDSLKNIIDADNSYMQNAQSLEAWMFINYIALHWYYKILKLLKEYNLNNTYSPMDLIDFLKEIKKVKIDKMWVNSEITKKTSELLKKINLPITYE